MYDMYPEWGPASHHPENPRSHEAVQAVARPAGQRRPAPRRQLASTASATQQPAPAPSGSPSSPATASAPR